MNLGHFRHGLWILTWLSFIYSGSSFAQSTPSEFAEMSLSDLFALSINEAENSTQKHSKWSVALQRSSVEFKGYLDGDDRVSDNEVLWGGPTSGQPRTDKNFPVVPDKIIQTAYLLSVGYAFNDKWRAYVTVPYLEQTTDHISIVPNYNTFKIKTSGVGDTLLSASYRLSDSVLSSWWLTVGLSIPTGSIDEEGDTPRAPGNQQLPYTMQLGSGTYDIPIEINYQAKGAHEFNIALAATIRSGTNSRGYRLGNNYSLNGRYKFKLSKTLKPYIGIGAQYSDSIHGADTSLLVPGVYPYPAPITNPDLYGGTKIDAEAGIIWHISGRYQLAAEIGKPLYQNLNGPQTKEDWRSSILLSRPF